MRLFVLLLIALTIFIATWEIMSIFAESTLTIDPTKEVEKAIHENEYMNKPFQSEMNIYTIITLVVLSAVVVLKVVIGNTEFFKRKEKERHYDSHVDSLTEDDIKKEMKEHKSILNDLCVRLEVIERLFEDHIRRFRGSET